MLKVNNFDDLANDSLDQWVYFFKNSEVKDSFYAKGLKEAETVLDLMRMPENEQYSYNRYLDSLHLKASEIMTLKDEAEYLVKLKSVIEIAKNCIFEGFDNLTIQKITKLSIEEIEKLR